MDLKGREGIPKSDALTVSRGSLVVVFIEEGGMRIKETDIAELLSHEVYTFLV